MSAGSGLLPRTGERIGAHRRPPAWALCVWQLTHTFEAFPRAQQMLCAGGMQLALNRLYHRGVKIRNSNDLTQVIKPALQTEKAVNYWALEKVNGDVTPDLESGGREGRWPKVCADSGPAAENTEKGKKQIWREEEQMIPFLLLSRWKAAGEAQGRDLAVLTAPLCQPWLGVRMQQPLLSQSSLLFLSFLLSFLLPLSFSFLYFLPSWHNSNGLIARAVT